MAPKAGARLRLLCTLLFASLALCESEPHEVIELNKESFDEAVRTHKLLLVKFYAPWCGHCKKMAPEYNEAAELLKDRPDLMLAKVDATKESDLASTYEIHGYPSLKLFRSGEAKDYKGGRGAREIVDYMISHSVEPFDHIHTLEDLQKRLPQTEEEEPVAVGFFPEGSVGEASFKAIADDGRDHFNFIVISHPDIAEALSEKMGDIVLFKGYDDRKNIYSEEDLESEHVLTWLHAHAIKWVDEITPDNFNVYVDRNLPICWLFIDPSLPHEEQKAKQELHSVSGQYHDIISLVYCDGVKYKELMAKMTLKGEALPSMVIETTEGEHFAFPKGQEITEDSLHTFLGSWKDGSMVPKKKTQEAPHPDYTVDTDGVTIVVGSTFKEVTMDKTKDVLMLFHAPWCGHCKQLAPIYSSVAQLFSDDENVVIAKMDATANEPTREFQLNGFPTIKLITAKDNSIIEYHGPRTKRSLTHFLEDHGKVVKQRDDLD